MKEMHCTESVETLWKDGDGCWSRHQKFSDGTATPTDRR